MSGIELARRLALLGAESNVATPPDRLVRAEQGWEVVPERWSELRAELAAGWDDPDPASRELIDDLGLSPASYWLLMLCAAVELYPDAAAAASLVAEDERVHLITPVTFARLARAGLGVPYREALAHALGAGPLRRMGLLTATEPVAGRPLTWEGLRLAPDLLVALLGGEEREIRPAIPVSRVEPAAGFAFDRALVAGARALLGERGLLCLRGSSPRACRQLAIDLASAGGEAALVVEVVEAPPDLADLTRMRRGLTVLDLTGAGGRDQKPMSTIAGRLAGSGAMVALIRESASSGDLPVLDVPPLADEHSRRIWALALPEREGIDELSRRFRVTLEEVREAVRGAEYELRVRPGSDGEGKRGQPTNEAIARQVRAQGARRMGRLITHLRGRASLDLLVVPPDLRGQLDDLVSWYHGTSRVYGEMGMAPGTELGRGLTCLFSGRPGTGKTFAAQCLANELGLNLYRIDLSRVVSKYIGETEKALASVFEEAEAGHGVLLFDEADALFGKRSEVKDAHDRYANIEVAYLLQRLESFTGVAILTTNLRGNIDSAFIRRLRFVLEFPLPDADMRRQLWEQALPAPEYRAPDLEIDPLVERFRITGGNITNIGVAAAHLAAVTPSGHVTTEHLVRATYRELEKAGRSRSADDFGPLARHLPEGA